MPTLAQTPVTYQYVYDSAGRLTEAIDSSGNALVYTYDAAGNLVAIQHLTGVQVGITGASTTSGIAGQAVTFTGFGFGGGTCVQSVTFNGVAATIVSSTDTSVTVVIPPGATSGTVQITTCKGTATSTFNFIIGAVIVTPTQVYINPGVSVQFAASVLPAGSSQAVTWSVDGVAGGNAAVGTITTNGFYTAPGYAAGTLFVAATTVAAPALTGTAAVNILDPVNSNEVFSPGVSVLLSTSSLGSTLPVYVRSLGVSVLRSSSDIGAAEQIYFLSPGVSVLSGTMMGTGTTIPDFVLSPGVSVLSLMPTNGRQEGVVYILSPGVSVAPPMQTGTTMPVRPFPIPVIVGVEPPALHWGTAFVTVTGTDLSDGEAVGFLNDSGQLDTNITVRSAAVSPSGKVMTLSLAVSPWTVPGRRRLVFWPLPHSPLAPIAGPRHLK